MFEERFGASMLNKISKKKFDSDIDVKRTVNDILNYFENHVFYDIEAQKYVRFNYSGNSLVIIPVI